MTDMPLNLRTEIVCEICFIAYAKTDDNTFLDIAVQTIVKCRYQQPLLQIADWVPLTYELLAFRKPFSTTMKEILNPDLNIEKLPPRVGQTLALALTLLHRSVAEKIDYNNILEIAKLSEKDLSYYAFLAESLTLFCPDLEMCEMNLTKIHPVKDSRIWDLNCHFALAKKLLSGTVKKPTFGKGQLKHIFK